MCILSLCYQRGLQLETAIYLVHTRDGQTHSFSSLLWILCKSFSLCGIEALPRFGGSLGLPLLETSLSGMRRLVLNSEIYSFIAVVKE